MNAPVIIIFTVSSYQLAAGRVPDGADMLIERALSFNVQEIILVGDRLQDPTDFDPPDEDPWGVFEGSEQEEDTPDMESEDVF